MNISSYSINNIIDDFKLNNNSIDNYMDWSLLVEKIIDNFIYTNFAPMSNQKYNDIWNEQYHYIKEQIIKSA